ncbi:MAG: methylenetetrahydrofolate reductase [NAD(P)H] [Bacteriovoracia bacterium]
MHIKEILDQNKTAISFEFFPPKSVQGSEELFQHIQKLLPINPAYVSVTYGAGGSSRDFTHDLLIRLKKETPLNVVSHLTCVADTKENIHNILTRYDQNGIDNIMALRGDPPTTDTYTGPPPGGFNYASELVAYIKKNFPHMGVGVAGFPEGHPGCPNRLKELEYLKTKVDAGADYICTQLFFDNRDFYDFCERCELAGIKVPIIAGLMPITSLPNLKRISELALGSRIPGKLLKSLSRAQNDPDAFYRVGVHWAAQQASDLLDNDTKGIHFYTLNKSKATIKICQALGISSSEDLQNEPDMMNLF